MFGTILIGSISIFIIFGAMLLWVGERGKLFMPSTLKFIQEGGLLRFLNFSTLHGYIYMRWQKSYVRIMLTQLEPLTTPFTRRWWADQYHGKILTEQQAKTLLTIHENIPHQDLEQVITYPVARNIVLSASPKIVAYQCACRLSRKTSCAPTQVCMFIGDPFASFMLEHHPDESKSLTQVEALELLKSEHERGHIHTAWFKNAMHDRFYAICNCCKCCCGGIEGMVKHRTLAMLSSGYIAKLDEALCAACGTCLDFCPFGALSLENQSAISWDQCLGCGVCVDQCPNGALSLLRDERKGLPLDARVLLSGENPALT